jgi:hypothetical protein
VSTTAEHVAPSLVVIGTTSLVLAFYYFSCNPRCEVPKQSFMQQDMPFDDLITFLSSLDQMRDNSGLSPTGVVCSNHFPNRMVRDRVQAILLHWRDSKSSLLAIGI